MLRQNGQATSGNKTELVNRIIDMSSMQELDAKEITSAIIQRWFMTPYSNQSMATGSATEKKIIEKLPVFLNSCSGDIIIFYYL